MLRFHFSPLLEVHNRLIVPARWNPKSTQIKAMFNRWSLWVFILGTGLVLAVWLVTRGYSTWRLEKDLDGAKDLITARSPGKARLLLEDAARLQPANDEVKLLLGACEQALGRSGEAVGAWSRVKVDSSFAPPAAMLAARLFLKTDRFAEAEPYLFKTILAKGKRAVEPLDTLVNLYKFQGRFVEARGLVSSAWGSYPDPVGLLKELENLGSSNPMSVGIAYAALEKASKNAPDDDWIWRPARAGLTKPSNGSSFAFRSARTTRRFDALGLIGRSRCRIRPRGNGRCVMFRTISFHRWKCSRCKPGLPRARAMPPVSKRPSRG